MRKSFVKNFIQMTILLTIIPLVICTFEPSNPFLPNKRIRAIISARISGPLYDGNFYKGYLPLTDFVFWVEDEDGRYIKTLLISKGAVNVAKSGIHAEHLPEWQKCTGVHSDEKVAHDSLSYILNGFDGITSASFKLKAPGDTLITVKWDFTDTAGIEVPEGTYRYCLETSNIKKDSITTSGPVPVTIVSESTFGTIQTRRRIAVNAVPSSNIKSLSVQVIAVENDSVSIDAVTSASGK